MYILICPDCDQNINISYHGECHYNSVRLRNGADKALPIAVHSSTEEKCDIKAQISKSLQWATDKDIDMALDLMHNNMDDAIDFLCTNMNSLDLYHTANTENNCVDITIQPAEEVKVAKKVDLTSTPATLVEPEKKVRFSKVKGKAEGKLATQLEPKLSKKVSMPLNNYFISFKSHSGEALASAG